MEEKYGIELELLTESFERKIKSMKKQAESIKKAFDPNDISGMTITGLDKKKKATGEWNRGQESGFIDYRLETAASAFAKINSEMNATSAVAKRTNVAVKELNQSIKGIEIAGIGVSKLSNDFKKIATSGIQKTLSGIKAGISKISEVTTKLKTRFQSTFNGNTFKSGLKSVLKYATALFSIRGIYSLLSQSARTWLSSQNEGAQQLSANIEYLKYSMGSVFAPIIQFITDLVYNLMKAIQSLIYSFTGINIFAKATASSMKSAAGSAKEASKALAPFDELNNLDSQKDNSSSGTISPTYDLSKIDSSTNQWISDIKSKLMILFEPLSNAWANYGQPVIDSIGHSFDGIKNLGISIGDSFREVWTDGTGEETSSLLLRNWTSIFNTIGNVGNAFSKAWENDGNGIAIIHNIWNGFNDIYGIIVSAEEAFEEWTQSDNFQNFANAIVKISETLSAWFKILTDKLKEIWENGGKDTFEKLLNFMGKVVETISVVLDALTPVIETLADILTPVIEWIVKVIGDIIDALSGVLDFIIGVFKGDWERAWNGIVEAFEGIFNGIGRIIAGVINGVMWLIEQLINNMINAINFILGGISDIASAVGSLFGMDPINLRLSHISLPRLDTGTNYVPEDQLAYIHKGEAVVPKKFNSQEYFGNDEETKSLLETIIEKIDGIDFKPYVRTRDIGEASVNYINMKNRQLGGSVIN